jgi:hypothetical protein
MKMATNGEEMIMAEETKPEVKQKRKAIQITSSVTNTGQVILFALCDDGTIWQTRPLNDEYDWSQIKKMS